MRSLNAVAVLLVMIGAGRARGDAKVRPVGDDIFRLEPVALAASASAQEVTDAVVAGRWMYLNPEKKTSTWESRTYAFHADGTVDVTTNDLVRPLVAKQTWKLVSAGAAPRIELGARRYRLIACSRGKTATLCLVR